MPLKIPRKPKPYGQLLDEVDIYRVLELEQLLLDQPQDKYLHWDKIRHLASPDGFSHDEWWCAIKMARRQNSRPIPLQTQSSEPFHFHLPDPIPETLHWIDQNAGGRIEMPMQTATPDTRDRYLINSLIEEAITSSQLEGATTTGPVAKELIRTGRPPRDESEQMIVNNYLAMRKIREFVDKPLTPAVIKELHTIISDKTLQQPSDSGRFRRDDENIVVQDDHGNILHTPPPADQLPERMDALCRFANSETPDRFVHPVIRSIIIHFWFSYDHPFIDGNGRTARALFYWSMLHHKYWLCEFISISEIIRKAPKRYGRAFLHVETDENDLNYFIIYHLTVIRRAIESLREYLQKKTEQLKKVEAHLRGNQTLNHRQQALISHALRHPQQVYTIASHQRSHNVVPQTARTDLNNLAEKGLLHRKRISRVWRYTPVPNLEAKLANIG